MKKYIMVIDEGTTGCRALIFNRQFTIVSQHYEEFQQYTPAENMVEHDAIEIYNKCIRVCNEAMKKKGIDAAEINSIGITNQRATSLVWSKKTGKPLYNAIVWQDMRSADMAKDINDSEWGEKARRSMGWTVAPVFSSLMLKWYIENVPAIRQSIAADDALFGTMDTWLVWQLTKGKKHIVSYSNASVMGSLDLKTGTWNREWLDYLGVPLSTYPQIVNDSGDCGVTDKSVFGLEIPIGSLIADQHAALFAQGCTEPGTMKCTNGTGSFLDVNIGEECFISDKGLNTVIAWKIDDKIIYAVEGYVGVTGSAIQWLRDGLRIISRAEETEAIAKSVRDSNGVYFVPALTGLSSPYNDPFARGTIIGITRGVTQAHIVRATLEAIAFRCKDICDSIEADASIRIGELSIDGGASNNNFLAQQLADFIGAKVLRPSSIEATSLGAAQLAGLHTGFWKMEDFQVASAEQDEFEPLLDKETRDRRYAEWQKAVQRAMGWKS